MAEDAITDIRSYATSDVETIIDTSRGINGYASDLCFPRPDDLIEYITNKVVLDNGSGNGGLSKECAARGIPTKIVSLNPSPKTDYTFGGGREPEKKHTKVLAKYDFPDIDSENMQKAHDKFAVAAIDQELPFRDEVFDVILDDRAFFYYARIDQEGPPYSKIKIEAFKQGVSELIRVLKKGGKLRSIIVDTVVAKRVDEDEGYRLKREHLEGIITLLGQMGITPEVFYQPDCPDIVSAIEINKSN